MSSKTLNYNHTVYASFIGFIVQAIINNFTPLLFLTFSSQFDLPLTQITLLITINFAVQFIVDLFAAFYVDKIGYQKAVLLAHGFSFIGLVLLAILPHQLNQPFIGLIISVVIFAIGGGLLEVILSPIVEASPTKHKESAMSLLHSFYCWGHVGVIIISSLYFLVIGIEHWPLLAIFWALVPLLNGIYFSQVPINDLINSNERTLSFKQLFTNKIFIVMIIIMIGAGASEQAVSQWMPAFSEQSLGLSKSFSDLTGPLIFAIAMGSARLLYGKYGEKISLNLFMVASAVICLISYLIIIFSPWPILSLLGSALAGFSVAIMWPGTFSLAAKQIPRGGTMMYAFLALAGDVGCAVGPSVVGFTAGIFDQKLGIGFLFATIFPLLLIAGIYFNYKINGSKTRELKSGLML